MYVIWYQGPSHTVCICLEGSIVAILERNGNLHVANVGDCGLRILRQGIRHTLEQYVPTCWSFISVGQIAK